MFKTAFDFTYSTINKIHIIIANFYKIQDEISWLHFYLYIIHQ